MCVTPYSQGVSFKIIKGEALTRDNDDDMQLNPMNLLKLASLAEFI